MKRKVSQTEDARLLRQATAYWRLAAKEHRAGNYRVAQGHTETATRLRDRAYRARARREARKEAR